MLWGRQLRDGCLWLSCVVAGSFILVCFLCSRSNIRKICLLFNCFLWGPLLDQGGVRWRDKGGGSATGPRGVSLDRSFVISQSVRIRLVCSVACLVVFAHNDVLLEETADCSLN